MSPGCSGTAVAAGSPDPVSAPGSGHGAFEDGRNLLLRKPGRYRRAADSRVRVAGWRRSGESTLAHATVRQYSRVAAEPRRARRLRLNLEMQPLVPLLAHLIGPVVYLDPNPVGIEDEEGVVAREVRFLLRRAVDTGVHGQTALIGVVDFAPAVDREGEVLDRSQF